MRNFISRELFWYIVMGILTTLINFVTFYLLLYWWKFDFKIATSIAWIVSVLFAYITNKIIVFKSKTFNFGGMLKELLSFYSFRLLSYFIDIGLMIVLINYLHMNESYSKILVNILIIVINYIISKVYIFKRV
ncbi:GtrA family protein [Ornithinibacillus contaminans]|uniref:GtrA family protein n=1 Tax=Ornithinibacillus contaminans TaxID=694055 RepID=UPI00064DD362|nr:GtrA family protein [Ornithinibacillus contaminans]